MTVLDEKYSVLEESPAEGFLRVYRVRREDGPEGRLYWFEVHTPQARTAFHRYKNALRRLEGSDYLIAGVQISANPGRYYVFWPSAPKVAVKARKLKPILDTLEPFGYLEEEVSTTEETGRPLVCDLKPQIGPTAILPTENIPALPEVRPKPETRPLALQPVGSPPLEVAQPPAPPQVGATAKNNPAPRPLKAPRSPRPVRHYRLNWPGWLPGVLLMVIGGFALWQSAMHYLNPPEYVLPDLVGKTPTQAYDAIRSFGLKVVFSEGSDPALPKDQILEQTPDPGSKVKPGRRLELLVNKPKFGSIPTVSGRSLNDARQALSNAGYSVQSVTRIPSGDTRDTVLASIPREGQPLQTGQGVRLLVASGSRPAPRETLLPDLTGLTEDQARYILSVAELTPSVTRTASGAPDGTVVGQSPGPGVTLNRDTVVRLVVAAQPVASIPKASPFEPPRLQAPPPPQPTPTPTPSTPETPPGTLPGATTPNPATPTTPTPQTPSGPQERRVNVSYTLPPEYPNAVVQIIVQDETQVNTVFEGPVQQPWSFNEEIVVRGAATLRILINGQQVLENPL